MTGVAVIVAAALGVLSSVFGEPPPIPPFGSISPVFALLVIPLLLPAVVGWAASDRDRDLGIMLALTVPTAVIGFVVMTMATSASPHWGPSAASFLPLFGVLGYAITAQAGPTGEPSAATPTAAVATVLILALIGTHTLRSFRDGSPFQLGDRIATGPQAGLQTNPGFVAGSCELEAVTGAAIGPGESVLFYGVPAGYAYSEAAMDTNILWLSSFGAANAATLQWIRANGRAPEVVIIGQGTVDSAGGWDRLVAEDPLIAMVDAGYGPAVRTDSGYIVIRRDGTRADLPATRCPSPVR